MKLSHTRLLVNKYQACFHFYRDVLGFEVAWGNENTGYADFQTEGGSTLALFEQSSMAHAVGVEDLPVDSTSMDRVCLVFLVGNVDKAYEALLQKGVEFITKPTDRRDWGIRVAHFRDPDGNLIEISEPMEFAP